MSADPDVREVGSRIELLLTELRSAADQAVAERAEELVRLLMELYGAGLERVVELVAEGTGPDADPLAPLTGDPLVASLLVLHGLHPVPLEERIHAALEGVRPYLGSHAGGVRYLGVDDDGVVHIRLEGSCDGCASSTITVKYAIENAIMAAAPEVVGIDAEGVADAEGGAPTLYQIGSSRAGEPAAAQPADSWARIEGLRLLPGQSTVVEAASVSILICSVQGSLYAYRDGCPSCGSALEGGTLTGALFACPGCATAYDVRLAGRSPGREELHLDPLPLLPEDGEFKVAVPQSVPS